MVKGWWSGLLAISLGIVASCRTRGFREEVALASRGDCRPGTFRRDWQLSPSLFVERNFRGNLFVMGDIHGSFAEAVEMLERARVARGTPDAPQWLAGNAILVVVGDVIDKGKSSLSVLRFLMGLEREAERAGGHLVVMPGNHEMAFLADPVNSKAKEFVKEVAEARMDLCRDVHSAESAIGGWLRRRPMAAIVNGMYFSHTGYTYEKDLQGMDEHYREIVDTGKWDRKFACGDADGGNRRQGFFTAQSWWGKHGEVFEQELRVLNVRQIVFGHDPGAFGSKGKIQGFFGDDTGRALIKVDVGLWDGRSRGEILRCAAVDWAPNGACAKPESLKNPERRADPDPHWIPVPVEKAPPPEARPEDPTGEC